MITNIVSDEIVGGAQLTDKPVAKTSYILIMAISKERSTTSSKYVYYALQLHFSGLSLRKTLQRLSQFIKRNHVSFETRSSATSQRRYCKQTRRKLSEFIIDKTLIKVDNDYV